MMSEIADGIGAAPQNPRWADAKHTQVEAEWNGETILINALPGIIRFDQITEAGFAIGEYVLPPAPPTVPRSISDRQFFQQLAVVGIISEDEALASNAAVIPAPLLEIIEQMPEDQRFGVKMLVSGATVFERDNRVTIAIGEAYGMSASDIDAFFTAAAAL